MKKRILITLILTANITCFAQKIHQTKTGQISFFSETPIRNIEAINNLVSGLINIETGDVVFSVPIKEFKFEKPLMQEHFNENYMESVKFPKSTFQGKITNLKTVNFAVDGSYTASVEGKLTMHGITKPLLVTGTITVTKAKISVTAAFLIQLEDFDIKRPTIVTAEIAESVDVKINCSYEPKPNEAKP